MADYFPEIETVKTKLDALDKKFPFSKDRKQDVEDAKAIRAACEDLDASDFADLVDVATEIGRLKRRMKDNVALTAPAEEAMKKSSHGPYALEVLKNHYRAEDAKSSKKPEAEKAKEVANRMSKNISVCLAGGLYWAGVLTGCKKQMNRINKVSMHIKAARRALKEKIYDSPETAKHLKLAEKAWIDLKSIQQNTTACYGDYWIIEVSCGSIGKFFAKFLIEATAAVIKLKGMNADLLKKLAA